MNDIFRYLRHLLKSFKSSQLIKITTENSLYSHLIKFDLNLNKNS